MNSKRHTVFVARFACSFLSLFGFVAVVAPLAGIGSTTAGFLLLLLLLLLGFASQSRFEFFFSPVFPHIHTSLLLLLLL